MPYVYFVDTCRGYQDLVDNVALHEDYDRTYNSEKGCFEFTYECCLCGGAHTHPVNHLAKREYP